MVSADTQKKIELLKELKRRAEARESLVSFAKYVLDVDAAKHHKIICNTFEKVFDGTLRRVILAAPPGSAKSTYSSLLAPAFAVGKKEGYQIISASHSTELAEEFGRKIKNVIKSKEYQDIFPHVEVDQRNDAAGRWSTTNGCTFFAAGAGAAISGRRADLLLIDDPYKNFAEANTASARKKILDWYINDAKTRLKKGGAIVIIATRWHPDDLTGYLLERMANGGEKYEVLNFQAICENPESDPIGRQYGEALWPEWQPLDVLNEIKMGMPVRDWSALYQQKPTPEEGYVLNRGWFKTYTQKPEEFAKSEQVSMIFQSWDTSDGGEKADFSVCTTWAKTIDGNFYLLDMYKDRPKYTDLIAAITREHAKWNPRCVLIENKNAGRSALNSLKSFRMTLIPINPEKHGGKDIRFSSISPLFEAGKVFIPKSLRFSEVFQEELLGYSSPGYKDDVVDSTSQALIWATAYNRRSMGKLRGF